MQTIRIWAPRGGGTAAGGLAKPMVFLGFSMILDRTYDVPAQTEGARVVGSGGLQTVGIAGMLCLQRFPLIFS